MEANQRLISRLKDDFEHSPVVSNVFFSFLLALIERVVEVEFACPCDPQWNAVFASAFFIIPAIIAFLLMVIIYKCKSPSHYPKCLSSFIPPFIWVVLLFLNGQYFVCANTYWPGTFVSVDKTYLKWCMPTNTTRYSSEELMAHSHKLFVHSQAIGLGLLTFLSMVLLGYAVRKWQKRTDDCL